MKGAFGTFRPGGKLRHFGRIGITEQIYFSEAHKFIFDGLGRLRIIIFFFSLKIIPR